MPSHIKLGRIFGIAIGFHYSWVIIAFLLMLSLSGHFQATHPEWTQSARWLTVIVTGVFFFSSIIVHELSHALVAQAGGLPVRSITLFALGGVAHIEKEAASPKIEFWMGIIGPITSMVISLLCFAVARAFGWEWWATPATPPQAMLVWLGYINFGLALFNLLPGFPLDGGRVLRALVWWATGDMNRSTRIAANIGQLVAFLLIALGFLRFFSNANFDGLWLAFIGWFLLDAARMSAAQVELVANLRDVRVGDIMSRDCLAVDSRADLQTFAEDYLLRTGRRCFVIQENGVAIGLVTPNDLREVERDRWATIPVTKIMRPFQRVRTVGVSTPVTEALETMGREDVNQLPVMSNGRLEGVISRGHILQLLHARAELQHM